MEHEGKKKVEKDMPQLDVNAENGTTIKLAYTKEPSFVFYPSTYYYFTIQ
jgi:hypothetical protein